MLRVSLPVRKAEDFLTGSAPIELFFEGYHKTI